MRNVAGLCRLSTCDAGGTVSAGAAAGGGANAAAAGCVRMQHGKASTIKGSGNDRWAGDGPGHMLVLLPLGRRLPEGMWHKLGKVVRAQGLGCNV